MSTPIDTLSTNLLASIEAKQCCLLQDDQLAELAQAVCEVARSWRWGRRLYNAGTYRSFAGSQHIAAEFGSTLAGDRALLAAEALRSIAQL